MSILVSVALYFGPDSPTQVSVANSYNSAYPYYHRGGLTFCCGAQEELRIQISDEEIYNLYNINLNWVPNKPKLI